MPFVALFDDRAEGFQYMMIICAFIATGLLWITFKSTDEVVQPPTKDRLSLADSARAIFLNPPLLIVIGIFSCGMLSFTVRQATTAYFFTYNVGDPGLTSGFFALTLGCMIIGVWLVPALAERFGKAGAIRLGAYLTIFACLGFYFTAYNQVAWIYFWGCLVALGGTPVAVLGWAMIPDTVEYAQHKQGVRADGAIYSTASFFQKVAKTVGGASVMFVLGLAGYQANQAQSESALVAIHGVLTLLPIVIMLVLIGLTYLYKLDKASYGSLTAEMSES